MTVKAALLLFPLAFACSSREAKSSHRLVHIVEPMTRDIRELFEATQDREIIDKCVSHDDDVAALASLTDDSPSTEMPMGRVTLAAARVLDVPRGCRAADVASPAACARMCVDAWLNLAVQLERFKRYAGDKSDVPSLLYTPGSSKPSISPAELVRDIEPVLRRLGTPTTNQPNESVPSSELASCSSQDDILERVSVTHGFDLIASKDEPSVADLAVWLRFGRRVNCRDAASCSDWCASNWRRFANAVTTIAELK